MIYIYIGCQFLSECFKNKDAELCYVLHSVFVIIMSGGERPSVYLTPGYHKQLIYITVCVSSGVGIRHGKSPSVFPSYEEGTETNGMQS